jgi:hypothetical protein
MVDRATPEHGGKISAGVDDGNEATSSIISRGRSLMYQARAWAREYPRAYSWLVNEIRDAAQRHEKVSVREKCERLRWDEAGLGQCIGVSNSLTAPISRIIIEVHPEFEPYITTSKSICDMVLETADE